MNHMVEALEALSKTGAAQGATPAANGAEAAQPSAAVDRPAEAQQAEIHKASFETDAQGAVARVPEMRAQAPHVAPPLTGDLFKAADSISSGLSRFKFPDPPKMHLPSMASGPATAQEAAQQMRQMTEEMIRVGHDQSMAMFEANEHLQKLTLSQTMVANGSTQTAKNGKQLLNGGQ